MGTENTTQDARPLVDVQEALNELGAAQDADGVAELLRAAGVTGKRRMVGGCPVARYLQKRTGRPELSVGYEGCVYTAVKCTQHANCSITDFVRIEGLTLPPAIVEFITRFDLDSDQQYPDLVSL